MLNANNEYNQIVNLEQYSSDSRLTEPSDGKVYDYRKMLEKINVLGRSLTKEEAENYRI
ncbi:MAG: hypothetical protein J6K15_13330 [Lachnospiraceae bacterium]|nr:hypothetical protein [Lachnospiraceae bacterium]